MASRDIRLGQLMRIYIDGLPLDLVSGLLPISTWFKPTLLSHIHLHAKAQKRYAGFGGHDGIVSPNPVMSKRKVTKHSLTALIHHLESAITSMHWHPSGTEWSNYYEDTNYSPEAMNHKKQLVEAYLSESNPRTVWDLGANTGVFSRIATAKDIDTIAFDVDPAAVEKNYRQMKWGQISVKGGQISNLSPFNQPIDRVGKRRTSFSDRKGTGRYGPCAGADSPSGNFQQRALQPYRRFFKPSMPVSDQRR